jgi:hypothetical protein
MLLKHTSNMHYLKKDVSKYLEKTQIDVDLDSLSQSEIIQLYIDNFKIIFDDYKLIFGKFYYFYENPYKSLYIPNSDIENFSKKLSKFSNLKLIYSIHCFELQKFENIFKNVIDTIGTKHPIIVTYNVNINGQKFINKYNYITFIKVQNKGLDLINKFTCNQLLNYLDIDYKYVFYLHSKSNDLARKSYLNLQLNNISKIESLLESSEDIGGVFPNLIHIGDGLGRNNWVINKNNMEDISRYLELNNTKVFPEGNVYILSKKLADFVYSDIKLFNNLNTNKSYDLNWIQDYYKLVNYDADKIYNYIKENETFGNLYDTMNYNNNLQNKKPIKLLRDGMYEHVFERIMFSVCQKLKLQIKIFPIYNRVSENYLNILGTRISKNQDITNYLKFDINFYKKHNNLRLGGYHSCWLHYIKIGMYNEFPINKLQTI